ncbi:MAG TPA: class II fructose-bisphosphate aldolase [Gemmatimonadales bacterium]|nr:class II fructose-bisphosphate aldolase [Gemmatimonadales bacterium]
MTTTAPVMDRAIQQAVDVFGGAVSYDGSAVRVRDRKALTGAAMDRLVRQAVFGGTEQLRDAARWLVWELAQIAGCRPASIQGLYEARGRGECGGFTVPAMNLRVIAYDSARAVFRALQRRKAGAFLCEIARSEMAYTDQRPAEYTTVVLAAALREGFDGPVFIQGDHFQVNAAKYKSGPDAELQAIRALIDEAVAAGFFNIDIDTSTLVDLSYPTLDQQQRDNYTRAAELTAYVRKREPNGVTISVGGEIGEVGGKNSTVEELRAFMDGYNRVLAGLGKYAGLSKISVQTGTSHGGVVLPDGSIAQVKLDLNALRALSEEATHAYRLAGAVQHGASTLPEDAFGNFPKYGACEIHLATNFQNIVFDHPALPADLKADLRAWVIQHCASERKASDTEEQFLYKSRKKAIGPFKAALWDLPAEVKEQVCADLERRFEFLFDQLNIGDTARLVARYVKAPELRHAAPRPAAQAAPDDAEAGE